MELPQASPKEDELTRAALQLAQLLALLPVAPRAAPESTQVLLPAMELWE